MNSKINVISKRRKNILIIGVLVPLISLGALLVASIFATIHFDNIKKSAIEVSATISKIEVVNTEDVERVKKNTDEYKTLEHIAYVDYVVDGVEYRSIKLNSYKASMRVGDEITVYCQLENPTKIISTTNFGYIFLVVVLSISVIYIIILPTVILKESRRRKYLLLNGECHRVTIVDILYNYMEVMDARNKVRNVKIGQYLIAKYNNSSFSSEEIKLTDEVYAGCTINLYLDKEQLNKSRNSRIKRFRKKAEEVYNYYLDIKSIEKGEPILENNEDIDIEENK